MHNLPSLTVSVPSNTAFERTAQSCALGALRGCAAPASAQLRRYASIIVILRFVAVLAFAFSSTAVLGEPVKRLPSTQFECEKKGGFWRSIGLPGSPPSCDLKTTDAGKVCSDSNECQGVCLAPSSAKPNSKSLGACSAHVVEFACYSYVKQGVVSTICVD